MKRSFVFEHLFLSDISQFIQIQQEAIQLIVEAFSFFLSFFHLSLTWEFSNKTLLRSSVPMKRSVRDRDYVWKSNLGDISHVV